MAEGGYKKKRRGKKFFLVRRNVFRNDFRMHSVLSVFRKGSEEVKDEEKEKREDGLKPVLIYKLKDKKDKQLVTMHLS